ncbi:FMN-dependent NADH-azoreductase [Flavivirga sp. 57AJ16]|uniref:FMN-dependent NADH-azoreductase n=1 Tax=Flavivirga sp. 57AJ16 TaxID=3025307 RepID=UPI0023659280|nr:NAD(P)H-dependent oxidoreductase [Flavivirga sp. 57AJ16]MDD7886203.1 NAD(P)H-dependent oxidoreductase [Flavivirga sp. 57AJ16]
MRTLLRIDTSPRMEGSHSRELAEYFEYKWRQKNLGGKVIKRDLVETQIPHLTNNTISGFYSSEESMTADMKKETIFSNQLIAELLDADDILISNPMYNFSIPSSLKAFIDQTVRINKTFSIDTEGNYEGLLNNKTAYLLNVKGGVYKGTPSEAYDYQENYLKAILGFLGITDYHTLSIEGTSNLEQLKTNKAKALSNIDKLF